MLINLNNCKYLILKKKLKKKYFFYSLICLKSRIKFKSNNTMILIKINNNMSILKKKKRTIKVKILDNKIFVFSKNLKDVNVFTKSLFLFCKPILTL